VRRARLCLVLLLTAPLAGGCGGHHARASTQHARISAHHFQGAGVRVASARLDGAHPCPAATGFTCATLTVPLDAAGQAPGTLRLAVAEQRGRAPRGVLLFLTGGPGQPGVPFVRRVGSVLHAALAGYGLVMFDQRGTGAGALQCPALQAAAGASDLISGPPGSVEACARRIGPDRRFFTTPETVVDIERLRVALGVAKLTLDGVSYGTYVAERYALRYPAHVDRFVLDSVVPHTGVDPLYGAGYAASARVLGAVCAAQRCGWDPAADLAAVIQRDHDGPELFAALVDESVGAPDFRGVLQALHAAARGSDTGARRFIAAVRRGSSVPARVLSQGLHESTLCLDLAAPWNPAAASSVRRAQLARLTAGLPASELGPFDRASAEDNGLAQNCLRWPATAPPALSEPPPSARLPPVPVLLLAGERDLSTPLAWARQEAALAPRSRLVLVPDAGHSIQLRARDPSVRIRLARFLAAR
jgi:pimeloyl-ACP methyl ester carboxylesterase